MPKLTESALKERLKGDVCGAYLIYGSEEFLVRVYTDRLINKAVDESFADFNLRTFEGDGISLEDLYESVTAVPMMAASKCVLVKDFGTDKLEDDELKAIETILSENPEDNCLIFSYYASDKNGRKFNSLKKLFDKYGFVTEFEHLEQKDLERTVASGAAKRGKSFAPGAASYFVTCVGEDLNLLSRELEKVCAYADSDTITESDINAVCTISVNATVFGMVNSLAAGKFENAFRLLGTLFEKREDEFMIAGALISRYVDMYRVKTAVQAGKKPADLAPYYEGYKKNSFKLTDAGRSAAKLSTEALRRCIAILDDMDCALKSTGEDARQILERTLVLLARAGR